MIEELILDTENKFVKLCSVPNMRLVEAEYLEYLELAVLQTIRARELDFQEDGNGTHFIVNSHSMFIMEDEQKYEDEFIRYMKKIELL